MLTPAWTQLKPHETQRALWRCPKRFVAVPAGRGSGKTELAKRRLIRYLPVSKPWHDPRYFYGAPTEAQAVLIAWTHLIALIPKQWINRIDKSTRSIYTVFGSMLRVVGMDKPQRIEGVQWDGGVLDESCDLRPKTFDLNVYPMLLHRNGWCWRIGVPKRQGPSAQEYRSFYEQALAGELQDAAGFSWPSWDILPPEVVEEARQRMDLKDFNEQLGAKFETAGGQLFYAFDKERNVRPCSYHPELPIVVGSDFNVDPMSWALGHVIERSRIEWFDELFIRNTNTTKTLNILWDRYQTHKNGFEFYGDATSRARHTCASESDYKQILNDERFIRAGRTVHYPNNPPSRRDRFAACNALLCNAAGERRMYVDPRCKALIADLENRNCPPGESLPDDSGDLGHMTDAMGYVVFKLFPIRVVTKSKDLPVIITPGVR